VSPARTAFAESLAVLAGHEMESNARKLAVLVTTRQGQFQPYSALAKMIEWMN
jgi:hypothetical protein